MNQTVSLTCHVALTSKLTDDNKYKVMTKAAEIIHPVKKITYHSKSNINRQD